MKAMITQTTTIFYPPNTLHDDPSIIAAAFAYDHDTVYPTGRVYHDGTCSCSTFDLVGSCRHVDEYEDYRQTVSEASYREGAL